MGSTRHHKASCTNCTTIDGNFPGRCSTIARPAGHSSSTASNWACCASLSGGGSLSRSQSGSKNSEIPRLPGRHTVRFATPPLIGGPPGVGFGSTATHKMVSGCSDIIVPFCWAGRPIERLAMTWGPHWPFRCWPPAGSLRNTPEIGGRDSRHVQREPRPRMRPRGEKNGHLHAYFIKPRGSPHLQQS
jgi:hypothetical protein